MTLQPEIVLEPSASAAATPRGLRRILGVGFGLAVIVGSTLGIGILRTPGLVAGQVSSPSIILAIWLVGGLYTFLCAVCLAELGTMYPETGGYYVYARRVFGDTVGFAVGWTDWVTYCAVLGSVSIAAWSTTFGCVSRRRTSTDGVRVGMAPPCAHAPVAG